MQDRIFSTLTTVYGRRKRWFPALVPPPPDSLPWKDRKTKVEFLEEYASPYNFARNSLLWFTGIIPTNPAAEYFVVTVNQSGTLYNYEVPLNNFTASVAPGASDDFTKGYARGSMWVDKTHQTAYICCQASYLAAVWLPIPLSDVDTSGTVTSVGLSMPSIFTVSGSPVTTSGTLSASLNSQSANTVFAGPASDGATTPTFRSLVLADLPPGLSVANDVTSITTTFVNLTDLTFNVVSGVQYSGRFALLCLNLQASEGIKFDFNGGSASASNFFATLSRTTAGTFTISNALVSTLTGVLAASNMTGSTLVVIDFFLNASSTGTIILRVGENSVGTGNLSVKAGSFVNITEV